MEQTVIQLASDLGTCYKLALAQVFPAEYKIGSFMLGKWQVFHCLR